MAQQQSLHTGAPQVVQQVVQQQGDDEDEELIELSKWMRSFNMGNYTRKLWDIGCDLPTLENATDDLVEDIATQITNKKIHQGVFKISTGEVLESPPTEGLKTYITKIEEDYIFVNVS